MHPRRAIDAGAELEGPFYVGPGLPGRARGRASGPDAVLTARVTVAAGARVRDSVVWEGTQIGRRRASSRAPSSARGVRIGRHARVAPGAVLGEGTVLRDIHARLTSQALTRRE